MPKYMHKYSRKTVDAEQWFPDMTDQITLANLPVPLESKYRFSPEKGTASSMQPGDWVITQEDDYRFICDQNDFYDNYILWPEDENSQWQLFYIDLLNVIRIHSAAIQSCLTPNVPLHVFVEKAHEMYKKWVSK